MGVKLNVPFMPQMNIGAHAPGTTGRNDPFGCWYASIRMLAAHFEYGPRQGLPELYSATWSATERQAIQGITELGSVLKDINEKAGGEGHVLIGKSVRTTKVFDALGQTRPELQNYTGEYRAYQLLCEREHLEPVPGCSLEQAKYDLHALEALLRRSGPMCFGWSKPGVGGHMSVLVGTEDKQSKVEYHDPGETSGYSQMSLDEFNKRRVKHKYAMLRRKGVTSSMVRLRAN
jgi:hypothetical protein